MSPVDSPVQRPTTPLYSDVDSTLHEALQESEERRRNREWREGKPVPFKGNSTLQDPIIDIAMEKKIEATLAKTEQPTTARSRKASHYLRVFKDADAVEDQKKKEAKTKERRPAPRPLSTLSEDKISKSDANQTNVPPDRLQSLSRTSSVVQSPQLDSADSYFEKVPSPWQEPGQPPVSACQNNTSLDQKSTSRHQLPYRLLEEIRQYGDLTPGLNAGSSFSRSLPISAIERLNAHVSTGGTEHQHEEPSDYFQVKSDDRAEQSPASEEEDDDSEREQISSALYFPHRRAKTTEQVVTDPQEYGEEALDVRKRTSTLESKVSKGWAAEEDVQTPQEVEISLQSQDTNQCLHGDISTAASVQKDDIQPLTSSNVDALSADSDYESLAESTPSLLGYESSATDDLGTTPTATTIKQDVKSALIPVPQPPAPLGAVELKPYDHQVGGHSTVYRFSRRAVCKQLNNRENEFYETVERQHPELLEFLPRYELLIYPWAHSS